MNPARIGRYITIGAIGMLASLLILPSVSAQETAPAQPETRKSEPENPLDKVNKRTSKIEMYPCAECHGTPQDFNYLKRTLSKEHLNITSIHPQQRVEGDPNYWCHNCHTPGQYNQLRLYTGETVTFNDSQRLCGQCHGPQLRDWKKHIHGRRTGLWNGEGKVDLCTQCHNPHDPAIKPVKPLAPPPRPGWLLEEEEEAASPETHHHESGGEHE